MKKIKEQEEAKDDGKVHGPESNQIQDLSSLADSNLKKARSKENIRKSMELKKNGIDSKTNKPISGPQSSPERFNSGSQQSMQQTNFAGTGEGTGTMQANDHYNWLRFEEREDLKENTFTLKLKLKLPPKKVVRDLNEWTNYNAEDHVSSLIFKQLGEILKTADDPENEVRKLVKTWIG